MAIVLSIGTTHPWNVAGVGRDLIVGGQLDARVFTAIAAVSAQDGSGVTALGPVATELFEAQLAVLPWQAAGAVRIGALPTAESVRIVARFLRDRPDLPAVVDPAFAASRSGELSAPPARHALRDELAGLAGVVLTPNLNEAEELLGRPVDRGSIGAAAAELRARGAAAVLLKGGHLEGDPADALAWNGGVEIFSEARIAGRMHGTGCTLAMALACELAGGTELLAAVRRARAYVRAQIARH